SADYPWRFTLGSKIITSFFSYDVSAVVGGCKIKLLISSTRADKDLPNSLGTRCSARAQITKIGIGDSCTNDSAPSELIQILPMSRNLLTKHVATVLNHQKDPTKALQIFNSVKTKDGFTHNLTTYNSIIQNLANHGEFAAMEDMFTQMRSQINNQLLERAYIFAMKSYGRNGKIQEAVNVFERMDFYNCDPGVSSYNAIMNILVEFGYFDQAHKVYMRMKDRGIVPDVYTFTIRIKSFCRQKRSVAAVRLLNNMYALGCEFNSVAYCTVIGGLYEEGNRADACKLFDEMLERSLCKTKRVTEAVRMFDFARRDNLMPDVVTFNTIIHGLCKNSKVMEAEQWLKNMINQGLEPDDFTYNTIIDGFCKLGMMENACKILNDAVFKGFKPDKFTYCSLIYGSCEDGDIDRAMGAFRDALSKGVQPSTFMYNTLIKGLSKQGLILQAMELMEEMPNNGCYPDIWTYNLLIDGLCKMGCMSDASILMDNALAKGFIPDIFTFNTMIDGYCKQLKMNNAIEVMNNMWDYNVPPDTITYNTVLNGLCKTTKFEDVIGTFREMVDKGFVPNVITYNSLIESLCKGRKLEIAVEIFREMEKSGVTPDEVSYGTLINGFCGNGDLERAYELFREQNQHHISHTTPTFNIMIKGFSEKQKMDIAHKLFNEMADHGCTPDDYTFRCMIDGFCKTGDVDAGYKFLIETIKHGFIPTLATFGQHRVAEAVGIVRIMVQKDVVPDAVKTIFEADKRMVAAPKIVVEDLLRKSHITYYAYELLYDGVRDKKLLKKKRNKESYVQCSLSFSLDSLLGYDDNDIEESTYEKLLIKFVAKRILKIWLPKLRI
ncbi:hypothetical protein M8C21_033489, partial [Ambrosia artemisiifolia]